ncbi:MAG TPA: hypothetical protein VMH78_07560 [Thermoplasmata archaeon]|nr:hypothetical protein [Thermoplasmata archaeon]
MATDRRFCRFSTSPETAAFSVTSIPPDGLCLSAFLVLTERTASPPRVLLGRIDPRAAWDHWGALDAARVAAWQDRWMLPASHLLFLESPQAAAERLRTELTGLSARPLAGPIVVSDVYAPERHPAHGSHWDIEFIFRGDAVVSELKPPAPWRTLEFVDVSTLRATDLARSHGDILASAGLAIGR